MPNSAQAFPCWSTLLKFIKVPCLTNSVGSQKHLLPRLYAIIHAIRVALYFYWLFVKQYTSRTHARHLFHSRNLTAAHLSASLQCLDSGAACVLCCRLWACYRRVSLPFNFPRLAFLPTKSSYDPIPTRAAPKLVRHSQRALSVVLPSATSLSFGWSVRSQRELRSDHYLLVDFLSWCLSLWNLP